MSQASEYNVNANGKSNESKKRISEASEHNANANGKTTRAKNASAKANVAKRANAMRTQTEKQQSQKLRA
jgi:hypothetical protein